MPGTLTGVGAKSVNKVHDLLGHAFYWRWERETKLIESCRVLEEVK